MLPVMHLDRDVPRLHRRHALRGIGASIALPLLDCMLPARAAVADAARPRRGVFIYLPNGVNQIDYQITKAGRAYTLSKTLASLEKHRNDVTPISGFHHPRALGHHHNCSRVWLTGGRLDPTARNSISVDQLVARTVADQTRFASLELSNQGHSLAVNGDGIPLPAQGNPAVAFGELFKPPKDGIAAQRRRLDRRASILDAVIDEADSLTRRLGSNDRGRLDQYLTSVREVERRTQRAEEWLDAPYPEVSADTTSRLDRDVPLARLGEYLRTMYDIVVLAFQTDLTRLVTFSTGNEGIGPAVPEIGVKQDRHSLSHHNGNATLMADLTRSDAFNVEQFAWFLSRLAETRDAHGPLLDSTICLYGSGMSFGHTHGNANLPIILAGGRALGLKHGSHVDANAAGRAEGYAYDLANPGKHYPICSQPVNPKALFSNVLLTVAQRLGVEAESFADSNGVVSEVLA